MKKLISILLVAVMLVAMVPAAGLTISATTTPPTTKWTDAGKYDLTPFASLIQAEASDSTVLVGEDNYLVKGDGMVGKTIYVDTAAELAGLSYLVSIAGGDCFKGTVVYITADIDLAANQWVPIGEKNKFRGSLVGAKGVTENATLKASESETKTYVFDNDTYSVNISNMYIDNSAVGEVSTGLVGKFGGDWIANMNLVNATVKAHSFTVGGFVGWQDNNIGSGAPTGYREGGYVNLESDADISVVNKRGDRFDCVGGIIGIINSTGNSGTVGKTGGETGSYADAPDSNPFATPVIRGCVFTGTISAPYADNVGGIIGQNQSDGNGIIIEDCIVVSEMMTYGTDSIELVNGGEWNAGFGGLAGNLYSNKVTTGEAGVPAVKVVIDNCYVSAIMVVLENEKDMIVNNVGGIVGCSCSQNKTVTNCQFDGVIIGNAARTSALMARQLGGGTFTHNVVTGLAINKDVTNAFLTGTAASYLTTAENNFAAVATKTATGGDNVTVMTADTDYTALDSNLWDTTGFYPVLKIAEDYLTEDNFSLALSGADFSWFNPAANSNNVANAAQLDALAMIFDVIGEENSAVLAKKLVVADTLMNADLSGYSENARTNIQLACGIDVNATFDKTKIDIQFAQMAVEANVNNEKPQFNGTYNVRVVAKMNDATLANVYFDYKLTQDGNVTKQSGENPVKITTCHREVITTVNGVETRVSADNGYYVVFDIQNVSFAEIQNTELAVRAYATGADGTVYYSGQYVDIVLAVPAN